MRRTVISFISCVLLVAGMASAEVQWLATDVSADVTGAAVQTVETVLVEVQGTLPHQISNYLVHLELVPIDVTKGAVAFGVPGPAPTDYLFPNAVGAYFNSIATPVEILALDMDLAGDNPVVGPTKNVIEIPILIDPDTKGKWEVRFVLGNDPDNNPDCVLQNEAYQNIPSESFGAGLIDIIPEPTTIGLLAFSGLMLIRRKRR